MSNGSNCSWVAYKCAHVWWLFTQPPPNAFDMLPNQVRHCTLMLSGLIHLCTNYYGADCVWIAWVWATFWAITYNFWFCQCRDMGWVHFSQWEGSTLKNMQCWPVDCHIYCVVFKSMLWNNNLLMDLILAIVFAWQQIIASTLHCWITFHSMSNAFSVCHILLIHGLWANGGSGT